jgi:hypothetical protein
MRAAGARRRASEHGRRQELFNAVKAHGGAKQDRSAIVRALEILANHEIGSSPAP